MVNEVVMYQSMFLLGVIMFGFFATSFNNYADFAENITLDNNLERVLQEVSQEIINLLDRAADLRGQTSTIDITIQIDLDAEYAGSPYVITVDTTSGTVDLIASVDGEEIARLPLSYQTGSPSDFNLRQIEFSGRMVSSSINTQINYVFDLAQPSPESLILS